MGPNQKWRKLMDTRIIDMPGMRVLVQGLIVQFKPEITDQKS
jgi:hypothetical protein